MVCSWCEHGVHVVCTWGGECCGVTLSVVSVSLSLCLSVSLVSLVSLSLCLDRFKMYGAHIGVGVTMNHGTAVAPSKAHMVTIGRGCMLSVARLDPSSTRPVRVGAFSNLGAFSFLGAGTTLGKRCGVASHAMVPPGSVVPADSAVIGRSGAGQLLTLHRRGKFSSRSTASSGGRGRSGGRGGSGSSRARPRRTLRDKGETAVCGLFGVQLKTLFGRVVFSWTPLVAVYAACLATARGVVDAMAGSTLGAVAVVTVAVVAVVAAMGCALLFAIFSRLFIPSIPLPAGASSRRRDAPQVALSNRWVHVCDVCVCVCVCVLARAHGCVYAGGWGGCVCVSCVFWESCVFGWV